MLVLVVWAGWEVWVGVREKVEASVATVHFRGREER